jgi:hypothetical protein
VLHGSVEPHLMNISPDLLYTTYKLSPIFYNANGARKQVSGTGFGLKVDDLFMIATCRHVLDPAFQKDPEYYGYKLTELEIRGKNLDGSGKPTIDTVTISDAFKVFWPSDNVTDVAVMAQFRSKDRQNVGFPHFTNNYFPTPAQAADVSVGEPVAAVGYVDQHDTLDLRPLLRSGKVASDPRYPFSVPMANGMREHRGWVVAYDCFSWEGLSGGPVFAVQIGSHLVQDGLYRPAFLAGVNAGHLRSSSRTHSGLSYFYRVETLLSLVNELFLGAGRQPPFAWVEKQSEATYTPIGWE